MLRAQQGNIDEAIGLFNRAVARNPGSALALNNLGMALNLAKRYDEAIAPLEQALALDPKHPIAHNNLGVALQAVGWAQSAAERFERAIALRPDYVEALCNRGGIRRESGRFAEARQLYERALTLAPKRAVTLFNLFECGRVQADDPYIATLETLAETAAGLAPEEQTRLHFALGKVYGDLGQDGRAFRHLLVGNALKRRQIVYDETGRLSLFARIGEVVTAEVIRSRAGLGNPTARSSSSA